MEEQVQRTRITWRRREGLDGVADLQEEIPPRELPRQPGRAPRGQVGLAGEVQVERFELSGGLQQQRGGIAAKTRGERDVGP